MATILIPTIQDDVHAAAVARVLEDRGHRPIRWFCGDIPSAGMATFAIGNAAPVSTELRDAAARISLDEVDVFWNRRVAPPILKEGLVAADREFATRETKRFVRGLLMTVSERVFSVNEYHRALAAENKLVQLRAAHDIGFAIPETLVSNDPQRIRAFLEHHESRGAICKSFRPVTWQADDRVAILYTSRVTPAELPRDQILQLAPAIFQAYVPKAFEVRVTCMGGELFAARLDSQQTKGGAIDWRLADDSEMAIEPMVLPDEIERRCRAFLQRLGLVFGCFDFIVTPAGDYVFLEINQMGQFLWLELANRGFPLLQAFCDFLVSRDPAFRYEAPARSIGMAEVEAAAVEMIERDRHLHVRPDRYRHVLRE
jgi:glutathione synthase/RimK-type ligase-like ATP-grasp enzyme